MIEQTSFFSESTHCISSPIQKALSSKLSDIALKISPIALKTLAELTIAISFNCLIFSHFVMPMSAPLSIIWFNRVLILSSLYLIPKIAYELYQSNEVKEDLSLATIRHASGISIANGVGLAGPTPWIHELGHASAAALLFKKPCINIKVIPYQAGSTSYSVSYGLTSLGKLIGQENSILFTTAAGIMSSTIFALFEFGVANGIKERFPILSEWMNYHAITQIFTDVIYGMSAFVTNRCDLSHDFIRLWNLGEIHPLIPIALMIALPVIELTLFKFLEMRKNTTIIQQNISIGINCEN